LFVQPKIEMSSNGVNILNLIAFQYAPGPKKFSICYHE